MTTAVAFVIFVDDGAIQCCTFDAIAACVRAWRLIHLNAISDEAMALTTCRYCVGIVSEEQRQQDVQSSGSHIDSRPYFQAFKKGGLSRIHIFILSSSSLAAFTNAMSKIIAHSTRALSLHARI
jgi:hypothetical protein